MSHPGAVDTQPQPRSLGNVLRSHIGGEADALAAIRGRVRRATRRSPVAVPSARRTLARLETHRGVAVERYRRIRRPGVGNCIAGVDAPRRRRERRSLGVRIPLEVRADRNVFADDLEGGGPHPRAARTGEPQSKDEALGVRRDIEDARELGERAGSLETLISWALHVAERARSARVPDARVDAEPQPRSVGSVLGSHVRGKTHPLADEARGVGMPARSRPELLARDDPGEAGLARGETHRRVPVQRRRSVRGPSERGRVAAGDAPCRWIRHESIRLRAHRLERRGRAARTKKEERRALHRRSVTRPRPARWVRPGYLGVVRTSPRPSSVQ